VISRRGFLTSCAAILVAPHAAEAQEAGKVPRVGILAAGSAAEAPNTVLCQDARTRLRFRDHAARLMKTHGFRIVDMWESRGEQRLEFVYMLEWPDEAARDVAWRAFMSDQEWSAVKRQTSAQHGDLVGAIEDRTLEDQARRIAALGPRIVVIKGGHASGPESVDLFFDGARFERIRGPRIDTRATHGTGCTFSAAIAAYLAHGLPPLESVARAKEYLTAALQADPGIGTGIGPVNHFHAFHKA